MCARAAWLRPTFHRAFWRTSTVLQLQLAQQLVLEPASKRAVQMARSSLGALAAGQKAGCDHAWLCKCCSREHLTPAFPATYSVASLRSHGFQPQLWQMMLLCLFIAVMGWVIRRRSSTFQSPCGLLSPKGIITH